MKSLGQDPRGFMKDVGMIQKKVDAMRALNRLRMYYAPRNVTTNFQRDCDIIEVALKEDA